MLALGPSGPPCVCTPAWSHFACTSTGHASDQLSQSLSLSVSLSLSPVGPKCTRARTARAPPHALSEPSCVYTPAGQLHSDGAACVLVSRTHARIHFASMRTGHASNQLSLSLFLSPAGPNLCAFARAPRAAIDSQLEPGPNNLTFRSKAEFVKFITLHNLQLSKQ